MNLKPSNAMFGLALTVALSVIGIAVEAQMTHRTKPAKPPMSTPTKATMSPPEAPHELWARILLLLKKHHGYTSKKDVEDTLGIRFTTTEIDGVKRDLGAKFLHTGKQELGGLGLVSLSLFEDPKWSQFSLDWGYEYSETPHCVKLDLATRDLAALGWDFAEERSIMPGRGHQRFFRKDTPEEETDNSQRGLDRFPSLSLLMPNQQSQCVNGFGTYKQRP